MSDATEGATTPTPEGSVPEFPTGPHRVSVEITPMGDATPPPAANAIALADTPAQVRVDGRAGVRVQHQPGVTVKRVRGGDADIFPDHVRVLCSTLEEIWSLVTAIEHALTPQQRLDKVRTHLEPYRPTR
jgi:hypothetical protein